MHKVFAVSAVVLLVATVLMMYKDQDREWKDYQKQAERLRIEKLQSEKQELETAEYQAKLDELLEELAAANEELEGRADEMLAVREQLEEVGGRVEYLTRYTKSLGAQRDVARANYDLAVRDALPESELESLLAEFEAAEDRVAEASLELNQVSQQQADLKAELAEFTARRDEIDAEITKLRQDEQRLEDTLTHIAPNDGLQKFKRWLMEQPIIDGFNSHLEIKQEWLPELPVRLGMAETARFDRCRTCHVNIAEIEAGNVPAYPHGQPDEGGYPHPFSTHPNTDLYLTATSPHPINVFGCTICHNGDGSGTSFQTAEHTPNNPAEALEWEHEHDWHSNHFWEYPMEPERFIESTCIKCHHEVVELGINKDYGPTAPKVYEGYQIVSQYGCFGCHEINGFDGAEQIGPDLRLEPQTREEAAKFAADPNLVPGKMRKVGPSLRHIASKTTQDFVSYWTEDPQRFRPDTRMPKFFHLTNQQDELAEEMMPVELAGIAEYLFAVSQPFEYDQPREGYEPDVERGRELFARRGCLACHSYNSPDLTTAEADFGPELSRIHEKLQGGQRGFNWLYTWIRNPETYHPRTKMPDVFLDPEGEGENYLDPAADIAAFLLQGETVDFPSPQFDEESLDDLVVRYLLKSVGDSATEKIMEQRMLVQRARTGDWSAVPVDRVKGDEIELVRQEADPDTIDPEIWRERKLRYIGRRTISRYGCYGCHDIPGFEEARPIGTALQDWGRKDTSKLAFEHIEEFLHHHGQPDGSSLAAAVASDVKAAINDGEETVPESARSRAFFYDSLQHHGRPGFIWQKLRQPRSYDYEKLETKGYDERLRMPKFPFDQEQIEAVATFVLGLVAEPPPEEYVYRLEGPKYDITEGERLLVKYNCVGCHMLEMPEVRFATDLDDLYIPDLGADEYEFGLELLKKLKPPRQGLTGQTVDGKPVVSFHGLVFSQPDPLDDLEDQEYTFDLWETLEVGDELQRPASRMIVPAADLQEIVPARGGDFAQWLVERLMETETNGNRFLAWQASPPPLYKEGIKVQTPWLHQFLRDPYRIRYTTVLRMPKFNIDDDDLQVLANYFAAVDEVPYPYLYNGHQDAGYLEKMQEFAEEEYGGEGDYLLTSWKLLNAPLCIKCHSVGGREYQSTDPQRDIRGPDLDRVQDRLRPQWTHLWLYKPQWITPYTSMPAPLPKNQTQFPELFGGNGDVQVAGLLDALMNYHALMERHGSLDYQPPGREQPDTETDTSTTATGSNGSDDAGSPLSTEQKELKNPDAESAESDSAGGDGTSVQEVPADSAGDTDAQTSGDEAAEKEES